MRRVGRLAANLLNHLESMVQPGVSTQALNDEAERWMQANGAISAQLGYAPPGYPPFTRSICTSVNEVVCHGIPNSKQILKDGDIILGSQQQFHSVTDSQVTAQPTLAVDFFGG